MTHLFLTVLNYGCVTKCSDLRHARSFFFCLFESRHVHGYMQAIAFSSCCSLQVFKKTGDRKIIDRTCRETERKRLTETKKKTCNTRVNVTMMRVRVAVVAEQKQEVLPILSMSLQPLLPSTQSACSVLSSIAWLALSYFSTFPHKRHI